MHEIKLIIVEVTISCVLMKKGEKMVKEKCRKKGKKRRVEGGGGGGKEIECTIV